MGIQKNVFFFFLLEKMKKHQKMPFSRNSVFFLPTFKFTNCEHANKPSHTEFMFLFLN